MPAAPSIRFDPNSHIPAVRQIADSLRILFVERQLEAGAALPSVRRLATELGLHFNTVAESYRLLAAEGWLDLKQGRGAIVRNRETPEVPDQDRWDDLRNQLRAIVSHMRAAGIPAARIAAELSALARLVEEI